jgi:signal transduction histidine kinase
MTMDARHETPAPTSATAPADLFSHPVIAHDELRTILSSLSHELCRPLISLRAGFDLLLGDASRPISADQRGHVETMAVLCDDLLRLTRSYLDYAGLVEGARPLCFGSFTVGAMVREVDRQFAPAATARRIKWSCALDGPDATVTTDASRCQQIFGNLVANALKYTPEGGEVRVRARRDAAGTGAGAGNEPAAGWVVTVTDNGPGIPPEEVEKVFAPFYRLARDERSRVEGNGLGLAICREMVAQLGGEIALHSHVGQGTQVTVRLPASPRR